jgi:SAM-dependent methyltransferase
MLSLARQRAVERWPDRPGRVDWHVVDAAAMPLPDTSMDLVVSSFMLQLVPDRRRVLGEIGRVLRPGGRLGIVTWLADESDAAADREFDEAVLDLELEEPDPAEEPDSADGEYASPEAATAELEAIGFDQVDARLDRLVHAWSRADYLDFKERFDEWDLVSTLDPDVLGRLRKRVLERWSELPDTAFTMDAPLVSLVARRPG